MSRITSFSSPFLIGFDQIERALDRVSKGGGEGYPPYNIEKLPAADGAPEKLRITLALAGFTAEDVSVTLEEGQLVIRGRQSEDDAERVFLHRGIAARQFQRSFVLADGMEVVGAELRHGLLSVDLARPEPERIIKRIQIKARD